MGNSKTKEIVSSEAQPNGDSYVGNLVNGKRHGQGLLTFASGATYEGTFEND